MNHTKVPFLQVIGHLGKDIQLTTLNNGNKMATIILATNEIIYHPNGESQRLTKWYKIIAWGKLAEDVAAIAAKGSKLLVKGKILYRNKTNKSGISKSFEEIVMTDFIKIKKEPTSLPQVTPF